MSSFENVPVPAGPPLSDPVMRSSAPTSDERTLAMLAELLQLFSWLIGPLIIFFVKRDSPFVRFHAMQAILWQAATVVLYIIGFACTIPLLIASSRPGSTPPAFPLALVFGLYGIFGLIWLGNIIIAIYYAVKASAGAWASYPLLGRLARKIVGA